MYSTLLDFSGFKRIIKSPGHFILHHAIPLQLQFTFSFILVVLVSGICFLFSGYIGFEAVAFILLLTLSIIAMFFDILPVLFTAILSAFIWDYFFIVPQFNLRVGNTEDKIMLSMYFVIALINAVLTFKIRQIEKNASSREEKTNTLKLYNTLLNSLSHEFRTPIAAIIAATDNLIANSPGLSATDKTNLLSEISTASFRLNQQVENLLNMSRIESGFIQPKKDWCDINELVYYVLKTEQEYLKHHTIEIEIKENTEVCKIDHGLVEQALSNLVRNAAQYTLPGSIIHIVTDYLHNELVFMVEDNGPGFTEEQQQHVFEKFYRLPNVQISGTGLGLSIVKGFIEAHNGRVLLEKSSLGGAKFTLYIPAEKMTENLMQP